MKIPQRFIKHAGKVAGEKRTTAFSQQQLRASCFARVIFPGLFSLDTPNEPDVHLESERYTPVTSSSSLARALFPSFRARVIYIIVASEGVTQYFNKARATAADIN